LSEELEVLKLVAGRLEALGIPYMLTGSLALSYYAIPRMTRDIDLVVEAREKDAARLLEAFKEDFYIDTGAVQQAIAGRGMFNAVHLPYSLKVDFIICGDSPYQRLEMSRRRIADLGDMRICIISPEDLLLSKLLWAKMSRSELQLNDVRSLIENVADLDRAYVEEQSAGLGVSGLLEELGC